MTVKILLSEPTSGVVDRVEEGLGKMVVRGHEARRGGSPGCHSDA